MAEEQRKVDRNDTKAARKSYLSLAKSKNWTEQKSQVANYETEFPTWLLRRLGAS